MLQLERGQAMSRKGNGCLPANVSPGSGQGKDRIGRRERRFRNSLTRQDHVLKQVHQDVGIKPKTLTIFTFSEDCCRGWETGQGGRKGHRHFSGCSDRRQSSRFWRPCQVRQCRGRGAKAVTKFDSTQDWRVTPWHDNWFYNEWPYLHLPYNSGQFFAD